MLAEPRRDTRGPARRAVLQSAGALGLLLGFHLPARRAEAAVAAEAVVNAWFRVATDGQVTIYVNSTDIGQGSQSGLAQLMAEELGCAWERVAIAQAPIEAAYFKEGRDYSTGGSSAVCTQFDILRRAAAAARTMLTEEAAERWGVPPSDCAASAGQVHHAKSSRAQDFGALAAGAAKRKPPADPPLKPRSEWRLIGQPLPRQDIPPKTNGTATFAIDVKLPGMLTAAVAQCPIYEGKLASMHEAAAMNVAGVKKVVRLAAYHDKEFSNMPLQETVAVLADGWWQAQQGLKALNPQWAPGDNPFSSAVLFEALRADVISTGPAPADRQDRAVFRTGDKEADQRARLDAAFKGAARVVEAEYEVPLIAHATMEPMSAVARWTDDGKVEVWSGTQAPRVIQSVGAQVLGVDPRRSP